jgi:integrase
VGKVVWGDRPRVNFILKKPNEDEGRKTFQILKRVVKSGQKPTHEKFTNERLKAINSSLVAGVQSENACLFQVREVISDLMKIERRKLPAIVHNEENHRILQMYWDKEYSIRDLTAPEAAYDRLKRAISAVGSLSLYSASREALQKAVNLKYKDNRQRDIVAAINQLLSFIGRGIELNRRAEVVEDVFYLTPEEFQKAQRFVEDPMDRLLQKVAFHSGLRTGENFALNPESAAGAQFFSQYQIDRWLTKRHTKRKTSKRRRIYILPGGEDAFRQWSAIPQKVKNAMRLRRHADILKEACRKAFPEREDKHIVFHDLRHSYAIYLVSRGVNLTQVAQCLNNSYAVCERYYSGFVLKDETVDSIARIIGNS